MSDEPDYEALQTEPWDIRARPRQGESSLVGINFPPMSDQEIRARALELTLIYFGDNVDRTSEKFKSCLKQFENYIGNGDC